MAQPSPAGGLRLQVLGPLRLWLGDAELDPAPRQQAYLLALLLAHEGHPVHVTELIDLIWEDAAPASALNVIHKYVGTLRRLLEPALPVRGTGSYLHRRGNGYQFTVGDASLDLVIFRELVRAARAAAGERPQEALDLYRRALRLWHGPAGDGLSHPPASLSVFTSIDNEFYDACVVAAGLAVRLDTPEPILPALQLAASMAPLHEPVQAALVAALGAAGQQAEALATFRAVRDRLAVDLGVAPSLQLQSAHQRVLTQSAVPPEPASGDRTDRASGLVGRVEELAVLGDVVRLALAGDTGIGLIEGEPGVGKTRLLEEMAADASRRGAAVAWGGCMSGDGTPAMWPWVQVIGAILDGLPDAARQAGLAGELGQLVEARDELLMPDGGTQFQLFEQIVAVVRQAAGRRPMLIVVDDLQWADVASLQLFQHLASRLPSGTAIVGSLRNRAPAPGSGLSRTLAVVARLPGHHRIRLGPLGVSDVGELVRRESGRVPGPGAARGIHARTEGNPFFVLELSRLLDGKGKLTEDAVADAGIPFTVRDIVRDRLDGLDDRARDVLKIAALIGRNVDLGLLATVAGVDIASCLDMLQPAEWLGLLSSIPGSPNSFRFGHDLLREAITEETAPRRAARLHLRVADALEQIDPDDESAAERLAFHLWSAGPLADPARTVHALVRAGRRANAKSALQTAERHFESAARVARTAGLVDLELSALSQFTTVVGMRTMYGAAPPELLERGEYLAQESGERRLATDFLFARWANHWQAIELDRSGPLARRLLDQGTAGTDPVLREYGLYAWGVQQWGIGNNGDAYRYLSRSEWTVSPRGGGPLRYYLHLLSAGVLAEATAMYGEIEEARAMLDRLEATAGDDPYAITVFSTFAVRIAAQVDDPDWALAAIRRGSAANADFSFAFLGTYQRLIRCWALGVTGNDPLGAAAEAEEILVKTMLDPPRSGLAFYYGLLCEILLAAGKPAEARIALDAANRYLDVYRQRFAEGLLLLLRARVMQAHGEPVATVRAAAERARKLSVEREAYLYANRADKYLATLAD
jgi:DNA-binding SARP family transcriptional activator